MVIVLRVLAGLALCSGFSVTAVAEQNAESPVATAAEHAAQCLTCHDFSAQSPVHDVLSGSHGVAGDAADMAGRRGCKDCHGDSQPHTQAPTRVAPDVSFGPHWTNTSAAQDSQCLACHEGDTARDWQHSLHMFNNLTCVTCHDIHAEQDRVLLEEQQAQVCTTCHKDQKSGVHGKTALLADNPPCSACHNPHDHGSAETRLLNTDSAGCLSCHDLAEMALDPAVSKMAKRLHKVMSRPGRTCLDCHEGIAHAPTASSPAYNPTPVTQKALTLFAPGMITSEWLLHQHPGAQPLQQGANCQQCHRSEEAQLGDSGSGIAARDVTLRFGRDEEALVIALSWQGSQQDAMVAFMWGDRSNAEFTRGGCFAACHDDMPGMRADRGQQTSKYLNVSRQQQSALGLPAITEDELTLRSLRAAGNYAQMWRVDLGSGTVTVADVLADAGWQASELISINKRFNKGVWTVELRTDLNNSSTRIMQLSEDTITFGLALGSTARPGAKHWVSLPMTLGLKGGDTDFTAE